MEPKPPRGCNRSMTLRRVLHTGIAIPVMLLLFTSTAHAALFLVFETASYQPDQYEVPNTGGIGSPGDLVRARTGGMGTLEPGQVMPAFLASGDYPSTIESPDDLEAIEGLTPIGELRSGTGGNGHLSFETPRLPSGDYEVLLYCSSCAQFSAGRNLVPVAPFRVTGDPASRGAANAAWLALVAAGAVIGAAFLIRRKRQRVAISVYLLIW